MSTRFESANSESAGRNAVALATAHTAGGWVYLHTLPSAGLFAPIGGVYGSFQGYNLLIDSNGKLRLFDTNGGIMDGTVGTTTLTTGTWFYLWVRQPSLFGQMSMYLDGSTTADFVSTGNMAIPSSARVEFATNISTPDPVDAWGDISLSGMKMWNADLAASNANTEKASKDLVTTTNAFGEWYFDGTDVTDHHTTANHLTAVGTLSAGPDSPLDTPAVAPRTAVWRGLAMQVRM